MNAFLRIRKNKRYDKLMTIEWKGMWEQVVIYDESYYGVSSSVHP